jgi:hypothetical protein
MSTIKRLATALLVAGAVTAPAASAMPASDPVNARPQPVAVVQPSPADNGFDWGDAGIGAAGIAAVALLSLGGVATLRRRGMSPAS